MLIVLNLKMHMSVEKIIAYEKIIHDYNVIVLPQYPYLPFFNKGLYSLGSQDVSKFTSGSYTGEVCAKALKGIGAKYALIGHSERKKYFNETMIDIKNKMQNVLNEELIPILCVNQKSVNKEYKDIDEQIQYIPNYAKYIIIAYEPDWLIGSDEDIDIDYLKGAILKIKEAMIEKNINHSVIYGGNVNSNNIDKIMGVSGIDGVIMSSSAMNIEELAIILDKYKS